MLGSYSAWGCIATLAAFLSSFTPLAQAQNVSWQATPFNPPAFPLAVKSPYASAWAQGADTALAGRWPYFWGSGILGWACFARVDNTSYVVFGSPGGANATTQTQTQFTTTRSVITSRAGPVDLTVTFLSPLDYTDLVRLSLPFSYFSVSAVSNDGQAHTVTIYADISGEWMTGNNKQTAQWSTVADNGAVAHKMSLQTSSEFVETQQRAQWGTVYFAANMTDGTTWQNGGAPALRSLFLRAGALANTRDTKFRAVDDDWPVLGIAQNLGSVTTAAQVATFVLGHTRNPAVRYNTGNGLEDRNLYFLSKYTNEEDAVRFAIADYPNARVAATQFDDKVQTDAEKISPDYASVLALGTRQAFASMEITLAGTGSSADLQDIKLFTKDTAMGDGSSMNGVFSTVDHLYAIMPMLIYTNPNLGNYGLAPLLEYAPSFAQEFAAHDLGLRYPVASSHPDQARSPVDATSNMIILTAAFMRYSGNAGLAAKHYYTLKKWADYLVKTALVHQEQLTGDWFVTTTGANQTNLALKGLIALRSMVEIQNAVGMSNESSTYSDAANSGLEQWIQLSSSGTKYTYGSSAQSILLHALYADKILGLNFVPESVYAQQRTQYASAMKEFGVPLTGASTLTTTTWQYFTLAALTAGGNANANAFTSIKNFAIRPQTDAKVYAPADVYDAVSGQAVQGYGARGHVGGAYAVLALGSPVQQITPVAASPSPGPSGTGNSNAAGRIVVHDAYLLASLFMVVPCLFTLLVL